MLPILTVFGEVVGVVVRVEEVVVVVGVVGRRRDATFSCLLVRMEEELFLVCLVGKIGKK